jgi:Group II intron, maturase-specific domain
MKKLRERVRELTSKRQSGKEVKQIIAELTLRGWGNYFRTGNADRKFNQMDSFVVKSLLAGNIGGADNAPRSVHLLPPSSFTIGASIG